MSRDYDSYLVSDFEKEEQQRENFNEWIQIIKEENLHPDPDSLNYYQAEKIINKHFNPH